MIFLLTKHQKKARSADKLEELKNKINSVHGQADVAESFPVDAANPEQMAATASAVLQQFGPPDFLVNCAGAGKWRFLFEAPAEDINSCMNGNLKKATLLQCPGKKK
jgi:NAD(P)-dependent dehydrogenase (short-subunit alcohol dehydrogenase family)